MISKLIPYVALMSVAILSNSSHLAKNRADERLTLPVGVGEQIEKNEKYFSTSGRFSLMLESDGNFVVRRADGRYVWGINEVVGANFKLSKISSAALLQNGGIGLFDVNDAPLATVYLPKQNPYRSAVKGNLELNISSFGALQVVDSEQVLASTVEHFGPAIHVGTYKADLTEADESELDAEPGWDECWVLKNPSIKIFATENVSDEAINAVGVILTIMTHTLQPTLDPVTNNPRSKFDGFKVFITNKETGKDLKKLSSVKDLWTDGSGKGSRDYLLGGATSNFLWVTEQMICKTGIETRNRLPGVEKDTNYRSFDQVVHEFSHCIDLKFNLQKANENSRVFDGPIGPVEGFAIAVQYWFGVQGPGGTISAEQRTNLGKVFTTQADFTTKGYQDEERRSLRARVLGSNPRSK